MPKSIVFEIIKPVVGCSFNDHYRITIRPHDPVTTCEVETQHEPIIPGFWKIVTYGLGVRKGRDIYDLETGCRMALASALRKIDDQSLRAEFWKLYLEKFPVSERVSQSELFEAKLRKVLKPLTALAAIMSMPTFEEMPIHRTWRFGENHPNGHEPKAERMEELKY